MTTMQARLMAFLKERIATTGVCPSYDEMAAALGMKSKSPVHRMVSVLVTTGHLVRTGPKGTARSLVVIEGREYRVPTAIEDPAWIVKFADKDVPDVLFAGHGATEAARTFFDMKRAAWTVHLFQEVARG